MYGEVRYFVPDWQPSQAQLKMFTNLEDNLEAIQKMLPNRYYTVGRKQKGV